MLVYIFQLLFYNIRNIRLWIGSQIDYEYCRERNEEDEYESFKF